MNEFGETMNIFLVHVMLLPLFLLPRFAKKGIAYSLSLVWYYILPHRKSLMVDNIKIAFPEWTTKQINDTAFDSFYNWALTAIEYSYFAFISKKRLHQITEIRGIENLEKAFEKNKGILILGTHTGNGELGIYRLCMDAFPLHLIGRRVKNAFLDQGLFHVREKSGLKHLDPSNSALKVTRLLKKNHGIFFVIDQFTYPPIGIKNTFFGKTTGTNSSLAFFALRFQAPVIPAYTFRENGKVIICLGEEIQNETPYEDMDANVAHMTQVYNHWIEGAITKHPSSWMWIHRRWKNYFSESS